MKESDILDVLSLLHAMQDDLQLITKAQQTGNAELLLKAKKEFLALHVEVGARL